MGAAAELVAAKVVREDLADDYFRLAAEEVGIVADCFYAAQQPTLCTSLVHTQCSV